MTSHSTWIDRLPAGNPLSCCCDGFKKSIWRMKKVFVSFSHDSQAHEERVLAFAHRLSGLGGLQIILDFWDPHPVEGWPRWMEKHVRESDFVLLVCTETYHRRVTLNEEPGKGYGATWEGNLISNAFYKERTLSSKFIPVLFSAEDAEFIPMAFYGKTNHRIDQDWGIESLYRELTGQPLHVPPTPKVEVTQMPPKSAPVVDNAASGSRSIQIALHRLPDTSGHLFGRDNELALLDNAWENRKHIVCFVAQGGEGKTALTRRWVNLMEQANFRGAERVYAWSFYSHGTSEDRQMSSDLFLAETLTWFGDAAMANSPAHATQKAQRLAALIRQQRTLLVLDGLEPLQYPAGEPHRGQIRDAGIRTLLKELANHNPGLVVVSSRVWVRELDSFIASGRVVQQRLSRLNKGAGTALLNALGVTKGRKKDFEDAVEEYHGHALALTLLGNLLKDYYDGDVRKRDVVPNIEAEESWGGHARRILAWYERLFMQVEKKSFLAGLFSRPKLKVQPELGILRILGLFDRPADLQVVQELQKRPMIKGITDSLVGISDGDWKKATKHLHDMGLLEDGEALDCHPLIREYFAQQLSQQQPEAWKAAHKRLYEYYKVLPKKEQPDTLEEMEPLYRAMGHGCKAGLYQEVFFDVHRKRIRRGNEHYQWKKLGAFSSDLAAISGFFLTPWREVQSALSEDVRAFLVNQAAFHLRALGRLREAIEPMEASLAMVIIQEDWKHAAVDASNLSELRLTLGDVAQAVADGEASVRHADASGDAFWKMASRTTLADALFQAGRLAEAEALFREAEAMQEQLQPQYPKLYSLRGYRFCDLLLGKGDPKDFGWAEVLERAELILSWEVEGDSQLDRALVRLSLGRAHMAKVISNKGESFGTAESFLTQAVDGLRKAGETEFVSRGLLARAALHLSLQDYPAAQADLAEAYDIAENGEMRLHLTDYHLESARLKIAIGESEAAKEHYEEAKKLIAETGYHRRDKELEELRVALNINDTPNP